MRRCVFVTLLTAACLAGDASILYAQASIAGMVRDTSNAVLPGVTVEAASPALIEKVRTVATDGTGQYKIENLRPGVYSVTFTLPGFSTMKREGIELTGTFTASVNAELRVGALEETITVTGETPIVDVQNTTRQRVLDRELISSIPSGRNAATMAALLPGVTVANQDVGGIVGESFSSAGTVSIHGNTDVRTQVNGVSVHNAQGNGATGVGNIAAYQEMAVDTSGISAEQAEGGVRMNLIPREGGNSFSGSFYGSFANSSMQDDNFTDDLRARGLATPNSLKRYSDVNPAVGGPVLRDKLWFHATVRFNTALNYAPIFFNKNAGDPNAWTYEPDTSRGPASNDATWKGFNPRLTWQVTPKNKVGFAFDYINSCQCPRVTATTSPEANQGSYSFDQPRVSFGNWTSPVTNRLLLEGVFISNLGHGFRPYSNLYFTHNPGGMKLNQVTEQSSNLTYRASSASMTDTWSRTVLPRVTVSYITGAHAAKVGFEYGFETQNQWRYSMDSAMSFRFNNGVPNRITLEATPFRRLTDVTKRSAFVQDKWTVHRLTVSAGLRYDYYHASFPELTVGPGEFVPTRSIRLASADGVRWHDLEPRSGLAFDVFGNGKTALKVSLNKYLAALALPNTGGTFTTSMAPSARLVTSTNRSWNDANRNFVPDCNLTSPLQNGECGAMDNPNFGTTQPGVAYDPATLTGWGKRDSNWQFAAGVQHEVLPRMSLDVSYFRTWFGNFVITDDRSRSPADYDRFSIVAPTDPRLPGGGGYIVSGLYDIKPEKFSLPVDNYITFADNYGKQIRHWNGLEVTMNTRPSPGVSLAGGVSTGRTSTDNCDVVTKIDNPSSLYCHIDEEFLTQVKFLGTYTVPQIDVQVTGTVQSTPGPQIAANYVATNAFVAPSLGRNLAGGANNVTVNLVQPATMYGQRMNQLDLRVGKIFRFGGTRTTASVDLYNVLNASPVLTLSNAFATWQQPLSILNPRFAKIVLQFEF